MRTLWLVLLLGLIASFVYVGCTQDPTAPVGNNPAAATTPTGGSVNFLGEADLSRGGHSGSLDNDIALSQTIYGTDFVAAGVGGLRLQSTGDITLAGVSGPVSLALLYWSGPTNSLNPMENASVMVNGIPVMGSNIGFSFDNCWGYENSQAYVADVTGIVSAAGNGTYALSGFGTALADNNGASLIVFYDDGDDTNDRDVVIFHGNDSNMPNNYDADGWNVTLSGINYTAGPASLQLHVADGQDYPDDGLVLNGDAAFVPGPQVFDGNTVPSDNNGPINNGNLWDIRTFGITSYLAPGPNTLTLTTGMAPFGDCLSLIVALIDLPAGAAPPEEGEVQLDLHPGSCPNPLNPRSRGLFPAAILGTANFDVTTIDPSSLLLEGVAPLRWTIQDVGTPDPADAEACECNDMDGDGILDLALKFETQALVAAMDPANAGDVVELTLTGMTMDGEAFELTDCVIIRGHDIVGL